MLITGKQTDHSRRPLEIRYDRIRFNEGKDQQNGCEDEPKFR